MSAAKVDRQLASEMLKLKQAAIRHSARLNWLVGVLLLAGVIVGLATWFIAAPANRDAIHASAAMGLGLATFVLGGLLSYALFRRPSAKCPQCGCDWNAECHNDVHQWLAWQNCPGCGLKIGSEEAYREGV